MASRASLRCTNLGPVRAAAQHPASVRRRPPRLPHPEKQGAPGRGGGRHQEGRSESCTEGRRRIFTNRGAHTYSESRGGPVPASREVTWSSSLLGFWSSWSL